MSKTHDEVGERLTEFLLRQHMFFVATAPLEADGMVNVSPKGLDTFQILGPRRVAYLDLTGSGVETIAHLRQNGRIVLMFCAFEGAPLIVRLHGVAKVWIPGDPGFEELAAVFPDYPGVRAVVDVDVARISDSCGFAVPFYEYAGERSKLVEWSKKKGEEGLAAYRRDRNSASIDGLAGFSPEV